MSIISQRSSLASSLSNTHCNSSLFRHTGLYISLITAPKIPLQEARSRFSVDIESEGSVDIDPLDGLLSPEGSATLHFKRSSTSAAVGRINCKVCLYASLENLGLIWFLK